MAEIGIAGLGKMGAKMAERLRKAGNEVTGYDGNEYRNGDVASLDELVHAPPREPLTAHLAMAAVLVAAGMRLGQAVP